MSLVVIAYPGGVYYVKVYRPTLAEWTAGMVAGGLIWTVVTMGWGTGDVLTALLSGRPARIESITSDEAQDLMKQLKPQEASEPSNTSG